MSEAVETAVETPDREVWPLPASHPSQSKLRPEDRQEALARRAGAEQRDDGSWIIPGARAQSSEAKRAIRQLGTRAARKRFEEARHQPAADAARMQMARAANAEMVARGEVPVREIPDQTPGTESRTYFYTAREKQSPYSYKKLDALAREHGVKLLVDRAPGSETSGLRYLVGEVPEVLAPFRSDEARAAHAESKARKEREGAVMRDAANTLAPAERQQLRPLTLAHPDRDPEGFEEQRKQIRRIGSARLAELIEVTEQAREAARRAEDRQVALGGAPEDGQRGLIGLYSRGLRLAKHVLSERTEARTATDVLARDAENRASEASTEPHPAQPAAPGDPAPRRGARTSGRDID